MTIEQELKELVLKQYGSVREFSMQSGIPYSTIDSIFKRGVANSNVTNILKICAILGISADGLAKNCIVFTGAEPYNQEETELLRFFRQLNSSARAALINTARAFAGNPDMQKDRSGSETA